MSVLAAHLRKEGREQRLLFAAVAVAVPAIVLVTFVALGAAREQGPSWAPVFLGGAALVTALALASDSFAGETTRGTLRFLRRQPGALGAAAVAKTLVYVAAVASSVLWAAASTWGAAYVTGGSHLSDEVARTLVDAPVVWAVPFGILVAGAWALLCSTWIPRGSVAVAGAALLLAAITLPGALSWGEHDAFLATRIAPAPGLWGAALALPLALFGWSMARGHRFAGSSVRVATVGLVVVLVSSAVGYAWAGRSFLAWQRPDPRSLEARLAWAYVARGERHAYVNVGRRDDPAVVRAVRADLVTGEVKEFAPPGHVVSLATSVLVVGAPPPEGHEVLAVTRGDLVGGPARERLRYFDAETGETLGSAESPGSFPADEAIRARLEAASRRATPVRTRDGLRAWRTAAGFDREEADGRVTSVRFPDGARSVFAKPWGWVARTRTDSYVAVAATDPGPVATPTPWGHPTNAVPASSLSPTELVVLHTPKGRPRGWYVWDLSSGAYSPVLGTDASDPAFVAIDPRRLLGITEEGAWVQVDVREGTRTVVRDAVESPSWRPFVEARTPRGRLVVRDSSGEYVLYDPDEARVAGRVIPWHRSGRLLHASDERALFLIEERAIDGVRWDDGRVERLFPR
jgi:hypothetical protein